MLHALFQVRQGKSPSVSKKLTFTNSTTELRKVAVVTGNPLEPFSVLGGQL